MALGKLTKIPSNMIKDETLSTISSLIDITSSINTENKYTGKDVYLTDTRRPVRSDGDTASSLWYYSDGTVAATPIQVEVSMEEQVKWCLSKLEASLDDYDMQAAKNYLAMSRIWLDKMKEAKQLWKLLGCKLD